MACSTALQAVLITATMPKASGLWAGEAFRFGRGQPGQLKAALDPHLLADAVQVTLDRPAADEQILLDDRVAFLLEDALIERARISAERIKAPILLISGTDDHTWPAGEFCETIVATLKKAGFPYEVKHVGHQGGGHESFLPYFVTAGGGGISGGSPRADAGSGYRSWVETIAFLHRHLDSCRKRCQPRNERGKLY